MPQDNLRAIQFVWDEKGTSSGVVLIEMLMKKYKIPGEARDWTIRTFDGSETTYLEHSGAYMLVRIFRDPAKEEERGRRVKISS